MGVGSSLFTRRFETGKGNLPPPRPVVERSAMAKKLTITHLLLLVRRELVTNLLRRTLLGKIWRNVLAGFRARAYICVQANNKPPCELAILRDLVN